MKWLSLVAQGRTHVYLGFFTIAGTVMHHYNHLDPNYIYFITVIMGFVLGHSVKEDYFQGKNGGPSGPTHESGR
jgi:hypothetical protein